MMKKRTKLKVAIGAIEHQQKFFVVERNAFKHQGMEFGRAAFEKYERLEEAKRFLQDMMQEST